MKVSVSWAQKYSNVDLLKGVTVDELVAKIGAQLGEVEEVTRTGDRYQGAVIARVVTCEKHPNADKLNVCKVDDGGTTKDVPRDEKGLVQVVCGAPNVREGLSVVWLPPGAIVPSTYEKEQFKLGARDLRGVTSNGMLASAAELAISDDHDGILKVEDGIKPGTSFIEAFGMDDTIIDIENKMFTHRPDCFGQLGVARELAGIQGKAFTSPDWYLQPKAIKAGQSNVIRGYGVTNEIGDLCPRYMLFGLDGVKVGPSPVWLQTYLSRVGIRPINNVVDITNYLMMLTGQPLHAFDFDKVADKNGVANIVVRKPRKGEKMTLLDGKTIIPRADAILICDQDKPIALGGVMGGNNSEIDENTTRILIECANFDMYNIRRTAMEHGIFTDSVTRFNKGQSPWQCPAVMHKAIEMVQELANGQAIGKIVDAQDRSVERHNKTVVVTPQFINERLGLELTGKEVTRYLQNVEFEVADKKGELHIVAPFWRTDIAIPEDIVEEVGRLIGYDRLPLNLPQRSLKPVAQNAELELKKKLRDILAAGGANEVLTYSFVHGDVITKAGQDTAQAFQLSNALSPDLQYYRVGLTPSLLDKVHGNIKGGFDQFALFEMNKTHNKLHAKEDEGLPKEYQVLAFVFAANAKAAKVYGGAPFYQARTYIDYLAEQLGLSVVYDPIPKDLPYPNTKPFERKRSAIVRVAGTSILLGIVGEYKQSVVKGFKLPPFCAGFELGVKELLEAASAIAGYMPLSKYPKTQQDISFKVATNVNYQALRDVLEVALAAAEAEHGYEWQLEPLDIYKAQNNVKTKHITFRVTLYHYERTLTTEEVNILLDDLADAASRSLKAKRL